MTYKMPKHVIVDTSPIFYLHRLRLLEINEFGDPIPEPKGHRPVLA